MEGISITKIPQNNFDYMVDIGFADWQSSSRQTFSTLLLLKNKVKSLLQYDLLTMMIKCIILKYNILKATI